VQRKKQRNTLQKAIAPQLFAGYALLTHFSIKRCGADFMPRWRALINSVLSSSLVPCWSQSKHKKRRHHMLGIRWQSAD
jgi:hypothetical protein